VGALRKIVPELEGRENVDGDLDEELAEARAELEEADAALVAAREKRKEAAAAVKTARAALQESTR